jgi:hypothetical protein
MMWLAMSCSAEAVAHVAPVVATFHQGKQEAGGFVKI